MRKILYISGTRADYGLIRNTLFSLKKSHSLEIEIAVTGMHLMLEFGRTINEIKKDNFKIYPIKAIYQRDDKTSTVKFIGEFTLGLLKKIKDIKPDIIFIQGDRPEMLAGAIVGTYSGIPVVHSHGGEVTLTVDEITRHAITKLSHVHLVSTKKSAERIIKMGEDPWRLFIVGAPGLDSVLNEKLFSRQEIAKKYRLDLSKPILLILQHSVTGQIKETGRQMKETMEAVRDFKYQSIVIYPAADPGSREIIKKIKRYKKYPFIQVYKNINRKDYLSLMKIASAMVGNSSSGVIEAPSFHLPVVNIGQRQAGRERSTNIIDADYDRKEIKEAIKKAIFDKKFRQKVKRCKNPYGDGKTGERIAKILSKIKIDKKLLEKQITY